MKKKCLFLSAILVAGMLQMACNKNNDDSDIRNLSEKEVNGVKMVKILAGNFDMGSEDGYTNETPVHNVKLSEFWMSRTEITNIQYAIFLNEAKVDEVQAEKYINMESLYSAYLKLKKEGSFWVVEEGYENFPVVCVTWYGAEAYCVWGGFRLPTEAEWEYAAKGGQDYMYSGSDKLDEVGWFTSNSGDEVHPVAQKKANRYGLYDMSGNVWEWCFDGYSSSYYLESPEENPQGVASSSNRAYRGGCFSSVGLDCRVALRAGIYPEFSFPDMGFRVVSSVE